MFQEVAKHIVEKIKGVKTIDRSLPFENKGLQLTKKASKQSNSRGNKCC